MLWMLFVFSIFVIWNVWRVALTQSSRLYFCRIFFALFSRCCSVTAVGVTFYFLQFDLSFSLCYVFFLSFYLLRCRKSSFCWCYSSSILFGKVDIVNIFCVIGARLNEKKIQVKSAFERVINATEETSTTSCHCLSFVVYVWLHWFASILSRAAVLITNAYGVYFSHRTHSQSK